MLLTGTEPGLQPEQLVAFEGDTSLLLQAMQLRQTNIIISAKFSNIMSAIALAHLSVPPKLYFDGMQAAQEFVVASALYPGPQKVHLELPEVLLTSPLLASQSKQELIPAIAYVDGGHISQPVLSLLGA